MGADEADVGVEVQEAGVARIAEYPGQGAGVEVEAGDEASQLTEPTT